MSTHLLFADSKNRDAALEARLAALEAKLNSQ